MIDELLDNFIASYCGEQRIGIYSLPEKKKKTKTKNVNFFIQKPSGFCLSAWKHNEINTKVTLEHYNDMCYILIRIKDRHWQCNREFWYSLAREMPVNFISGMVQPLSYTPQIQMTEVD